MRILHITSSIDPRAGGTTTALVALASAQREVGLDVGMASTFPQGFRTDAAEQLRSAGVDVTLIGPNRKLLAYHPAILSTIEPLVQAADVVHIHALWEEIQHRAAALARKYVRPYLFTPHGMLDPWSLNQGRLKKQLYLTLRLRKDLNAAAAIHFTDEIERDLTRELRLRPPGLVERHIVALGEFEKLPIQGTFRAKQPVIGGRRIVLFMSRLHPKKGLDLLIPAFAKAAVTDAVLVLAGPCEAQYQVQLAQLANTAGIADRTIFTGMLYGADRVAAMVDAEVLVLPSYQENFGIVVVESLAAGTPVIISDQVNIHRQISAANVGSVVRAQVEPLAAAIREMLCTPERTQMASRAREFVSREYDRNTIARRWVSHYQELTASSAPANRR